MPDSKCQRCAARERDWWKPEPADPFWMIEAEDGEWLRNEHSLLGTKDPARALRFPTEKLARQKQTDIFFASNGTKWWGAKPTEHSWVMSTPSRGGHDAG